MALVRAPLVLRSISVPLILGMLTVSATPGQAAPRRPATPPEAIDRSIERALAVEATDATTIPEALPMPKIVRPPQSAAPATEAAAPLAEGAAEPPAGPTVVARGDTRYVIEDAGEVELDEAVQAALAAEPEDAGKLRRQRRIYLGIGIPLLTLGATALVSGAVLGTYDDTGPADDLASDLGISDAQEFWVPLMLTGALAVAAGAPLLARGVVLRDRIEAAEEAERARAQGKKAALAPSFGRTRDGTWTTGLVGRF